MKKIPTNTIELYRVAISGLLLAFSLWILFEIKELYLVGVASAIVIVGFIFAKSATKHFGHDHKHAGDSAIDAIPVIVLIFANIAHPAIDGFSLGQTFRFAGVLPGVLLALSIVLHEFIRQSAIISALSFNKINWRWIVVTAFLGISLGIGASIYGTNFFQKYETVAELATLFSYSFIIGEFYFLRSSHKNKYTWAILIGGVVLGILILMATNVH